MTAPQIIKSPSGDELVVLSRADYDAMVAALAEAAEDAADAQLAAKVIAEIGDTPPLSPAESGAILLRNGFLRSVRKARGLTQQELAKAAGITQGALSDIESGRRNASPGGPAEARREARRASGSVRPAGSGAG